ncbi:glutathione S-transferase family protein [Pseudoprimorskyibacter insulae]|uniref:GST N-terminal domain-containing protein n=1 Tax=Pseudoprimorskyibacter insulae TaxID=1695997 RepID=A0A2R8ATE9_9RHOB|nr:glutathione S-transferase family protein [Pseudoprimorskyibacter insulae]SPF79336.1 hypothetical protein PRI8871_01131 [Pseudoprimorskyibacter insulae]
MTDLLLFGHPDSGHACKVALALSMAGFDHKTQWVDIWADPATRPAEFLAASPFAEVPCLMINGVAHVQSGAILMEIASRFGVLGGESAEGLRRGREILMWEANRIGMCVPQLKEARRVQNEGFPDGAIEWLTIRFNADVKNFDRLLGDANFLHGAFPGFGDCAVWGYTQWLAVAGLEPSAKMAGWLDRMRAHPAMKTPAQFFPQ